MTEEVNFLESPFQTLKSKYNILDISFNIKRLAQFYKYLQESLDSKIHSIYISVQLQLAEIINVLLARYQSCIYDPVLKGLSLNAQVTTMNAIDFENKSTSLFLKFQINDSQDDIRLDAYNGFALQLMLPDSPHFIKTLDIFKTFYNKNGENRVWDLKNYLGPESTIIIKDDRIEIEKPDYLPHITEDPIVLRNFADILEEKGLRIPTVLMAKRIIGPSLRDIVYSLDNNNIDYYLPRLKNLFNTMIDLGKYGFIHNDSHVNNVLFDLKTQEFCLIDYGRVSIDPKFLGTKGINLNQYVEWVQLQTDYNYLTKYFKNYQHSKKTFEYNFYYSNTVSENYISYKFVHEITNNPILQNLLIKSLPLFDISTMTLGILDPIYIPRTEQKPTDDMRIIINETLLNYQILNITNDKLIIREFNDLSKLLSTTDIITLLQGKNVDTLLPGIIWASFIFTSLYEVDPTDEIVAKIEGIQSVLVIDRHLLKKHHLMHYYYQYGLSLLWKCRTTLFKYLHIAVQYILQILPPKNLNGGMLSSRIPMSVRSLRSNYLSKPRRVKPKPIDGQMDSVINYNRTEAPPKELTQWLKNYKPIPVPKVQPNENPFTALAPYLEVTRIQNEKYHPFVEELKKYKAEIPPKYKSKVHKQSKDGITSRSVRGRSS